MAKKKSKKKGAKQSPKKKRRRMPRVKARRGPVQLWLPLQMPLGLVGGEVGEVPVVDLAPALAERPPRAEIDAAQVSLWD